MEQLINNAWNKGETKAKERKEKLEKAHKKAEEQPFHPPSLWGMRQNSWKGQDEEEMHKIFNEGWNNVQKIKDIKNHVHDKEWKEKLENR